MTKLRNNKKDKENTYKKHKNISEQSEINLSQYVSRSSQLSYGTHKNKTQNNTMILTLPSKMIKRIQ